MCGSLTRARQALPKHSLQRTASGDSRRRAACRSSAWVACVAVSVQGCAEQRLAWRVRSGCWQRRPGRRRTGSTGVRAQGSGWRRRPGYIAQCSSLCGVVRVGTRWRHRGLCVAASYVCGCAHRHGVVVKLVALVVRERRVVRRSRPLELGVRVHGLGLGCSLQTWCLVVCFETRAIACVCGNRRGRCVGNKTFHEKRAAARVFHL